MNQIKAALIGVCLGTLVGLISATLVAMGATIFFGRTLDLGQSLLAGAALIPFSLLNGLCVGGVSGAVGRALSARETAVFTVLISIAITSIIVMAGNFDTHSLMPVAFYGLAFLNGVLAAPVVVNVLYGSSMDGKKRLAPWR